MIYQLGLKQGWLCVIGTDAEWSRPLAYRLWWPVCRMSKGGLQSRGITEGQEIYPISNDLFTCSRGLGLGTLKFRLRDGGPTKPICREEIPIPPPRCRVETRYHNGTWQKYLKTRGWVDVPTPLPSYLPERQEARP